MKKDLVELNKKYVEELAEDIAGGWHQITTLESSQADAVRYEEEGQKGMAHMARMHVEAHLLAGTMQGGNCEKD